MSGNFTKIEKRIEATIKELKEIKGEISKLKGIIRDKAEDNNIDKAKERLQNIKQYAEDSINIIEGEK